VKPQAAGLAVSPQTFVVTGRMVKGHCVVTAQSNRTQPACKRTVALRVSFTLNIPARVTFTLQQAASGRLVNRRCVAPTKSSSHKRSCTRLVAVPGSFARNGAAGTNSFTFNGQVGPRKPTIGSYWLTAFPATNGQVGNAQRVSFKISG
jgi:hypothetical protein